MSRPTPATYKTTNWPAYNDALKRRGSLTIWFDPEMSWEGLCCANLVRDSSRDSSVVAVVHEQTEARHLPHHELACLQRGAGKARVVVDLVRS